MKWDEWEMFKKGRGEMENDYRYKHITNSLPPYRSSLFVSDMANGAKSHHYGTTTIARTRTPAVLLPGKKQSKGNQSIKDGARC